MFSQADVAPLSGVLLDAAALLGGRRGLSTVRGRVVFRGRLAGRWFSFRRMFLRPTASAMRVWHDRVRAVIQ